MWSSKRLVLVALVALVLRSTSALQNDEKACEVCVKVIDDLKVTYEQLRTENPGKNEQEVAELAVTKQCGKKLNRKDNKLCYNLEPMKSDVARQVRINKESLKICKFLEQKNPDFCSMRYHANTDYSKMRVKQLRKILGERGVECVGCVEKADFIAKIKETESMRTEL